MSTSLAENAVFASRYRIVRCIAAGGMGSIYEVVHLETDRRRALKVMHPHFVQSAELRERFKGEARVAARIDSDYIVDVFDAGIDEATQMPFLVMELLKGEELGKRLARYGKFSPVDALNFLWQTALALDKTHKANIVHRDLKPDNLFLNERDDGPPRVKVLDFGVAKFVAEAGTQANVTRSVGTPLYMAPEQFRGVNVASGCDNYALAMMAFTMLVGEAYWAPEANTESTVFGFATHVQGGPVERASARAARRGVALTFDFDRWFHRATNVSPAERYPSATATIAALGQVLGIDPGRLTGVAASDPLAPALAAPRQSGTEVLGPPGLVARSGAISGVAQGTNAGGVVTPVRPKSRAGTFAVVGVGVLVVAGIGAIAVSMRGRPRTEASASAAPEPDTARATASAPVVAPALPPASAASADPSAPADAPTATATADAAASATVGAPRPNARPGGRGALAKPSPQTPPTAQPPPTPVPAPPPATAGKPSTYTRD